MLKNVKYPIRINAYLAKHGFASRREADKMIAAGKVFLNGRKAVLGDKVQERDEVVVDKKAQARREETFAYFAFNKPVDVVSNPEAGQRSITEIVKIKGVYPIGRLDKESSGLIILSNDGRITGRLLEAEENHEKEYRVTVDKPLTPMFQKAITSGLKLEDFTAKPCQIKKISPTEFNLTLTEGKKHQIRRMCAALGYQVRTLERVRIMNIKLDNLKEGQIRPIADQEKEEFLRTLGLK
ncbi:MAG: pseudouridine synthase [Candidatus Vogelbacteria bacterium]|nr:pseudouridine synthase [Candidatus Vogelbacteria bacterium]